MNPNPHADARDFRAPIRPPFAAGTGTTTVDSGADRDRRRIARRRAGARLGFLIHLAVYVVVNASLFAIDLVSSPEVRWVHYPLLGWGLGLAIHGLVVHLLPFAGALHARLTEQELRRLQK